MRIAGILLVSLCVVVLPLVLGQGCPPEGVTDQVAGSGSNTSDLTDAEKAAINAGANAAGGLAKGTETAQNGTGQNGDSEQPIRSDICLGTCPQVCTTGSVLSGQVTLSIDFGDGCTAWVDPDDGTTYDCSGSASGSISQSAKTIDLTFNSINCHQQTLDGSADLTYNLSTTEVQFSGDWDLTWKPGNETFGTEGSGTGGYHFVTDVTSIPTFSGSVSDETVPEQVYEWSIEMTDILVSYLTYWSYIPYSGTMTLSGVDIRSLTLRFNENSPTTGEIEVSIGGGPYFAANVYTLAEAIQ